MTFKINSEDTKSNNVLLGDLKPGEFFTFTEGHLEANIIMQYVAQKSQGELYAFISRAFGDVGTEDSLTPVRRVTATFTPVEEKPKDGLDCLRPGQTVATYFDESYGGPVYGVVDTEQRYIYTNEGLIIEVGSVGYLRKNGYKVVVATAFEVVKPK